MERVWKYKIGDVLENINPRRTSFGKVGVVIRYWSNNNETAYMLKYKKDGRFQYPTWMEKYCREYCAEEHSMKGHKKGRENCLRCNPK